MAWKIVAAIALIAGTSAQVLAQGLPAPPGQPSPTSPDSAAAARDNREQQESYNRLLHQGVPINEADRQRSARNKHKGPVPATTADLVAGAAVRDKAGLQIATVERLEADGAVVRAGDRLAKIPVDAFGKDDGGLLIAITADEFRTAIAQTSVPVPQEQPQVAAATAADMAPGATVRDSEGVPIGTVDSVVESGVILLTDGRKVKLAVDSLGKDAKGLQIGITASELKAMIGNSASAASGS